MDKKKVERKFRRPTKNTRQSRFIFIVLSVILHASSITCPSCTIENDDHRVETKSMTFVFREICIDFFKMASCAAGERLFILGGTGNTRTTRRKDNFDSFAALVDLE